MHSEPKAATTIIFEKIRELAAAGLGYEDIAVLLRLPKSQVRPFVLGRAK